MPSSSESEGGATTAKKKKGRGNCIRRSSPSPDCAGLGVTRLSGRASRAPAVSGQWRFTIPPPSANGLAGRVPLPPFPVPHARLYGVYVRAWQGAVGPGRARRGMADAWRCGPGGASSFRIVQQPEGCLATNAAASLKRPGRIRLRALPSVPNQLRGSPLGCYLCTDAVDEGCDSVAIGHPHRR
jgi:hypothetical protein